jgi:hypothetical protein
VIRILFRPEPVPGGAHSSQAAASSLCTHGQALTISPFAIFCWISLGGTISASMVSFGNVAIVLHGGMAGGAQAARWESHRDGHCSTISVVVVKAVGAVGHAILRMAPTAAQSAATWRALAWSAQSASTMSGKRVQAVQPCDHPHHRTVLRDAEEDLSQELACVAFSDAALQSIWHPQSRPSRCYRACGSHLPPAAGWRRPATRHPASGGEGSSPLQLLAPTAPADGTSPEDASSGAALGVDENFKTRNPDAPMVLEVEQRQRDALDRSAAPAASSGSAEEERGRESGINAASGATDWQRRNKSASPRRRRRSRSKSAMGRSRSTSSSSDEGSPERADVTPTLYSPRRRIANLPADAKEELRQVRRREDVQQKFSGFQWHPAGKDPASGGQQPSILKGSIGKETSIWEQIIEKQKTDVWSQLPSFAQPMPSAHDFVKGIPHHSDKEKDKLWPVVEAIASTKMHYLTKIKQYFDGDHDSASGEWLFDKMWPDTSPESNGSHPLSEEGVQRLYREGLVKNKADHVKHILTKHDGEARIIIDQGYERLPDGVDIHDACFWQYQYARTRDVRHWLYKRSMIQKNNNPLTDQDIQWILAEEENRTLLLCWEPRPRSNPASGGKQLLKEGDWKIRTGNYITLAELFKFGARQVTCYHLYLMYLGLDVYIHRRNHSQSTSDKMQNAKRYHETGYWGLPSSSGSWEPPKKKR